MRRSVQTALAALAVALLAPFEALPATRSNETPTPHIGYVYPAGGAQGSVFEIRAGGENVYGCEGAIVSGKGVAVEVIDAKEPKEGKKKRKDTSVIDEVVRLKVSIAKDALPGKREIRLNAPLGLSNSLAFQIGELPETLEDSGAKKGGVQELSSLPTTVNGQITPGEVDRYSFKVKAGQRIVADCSARALIPYIADAVPGWFQADIALYDEKGEELAHAFDWKFRQDPAILYECKADGKLTLAVKDSIFRGREDFVYRIRLGELPFIKSVYPLGARAGQAPAKIALDAWNIPSPLLFVDVREPGEKSLSAKPGGLLSNAVQFSVDELPEIDAEPSSRKEPQSVSLPVVVNGKLRSPGAAAFFAFAGSKGRKIVVETAARRLGSPLDSKIALYGPDGELLKDCDDWKDPAEAMLTHNADSRIELELPADGRYAVKLWDVQGGGGEDFAYRLRVSEPQPDFELRVAPSSVSVPAGGSASLSVSAIRKDGFKDAIKLVLKDAGGSLRLDGGEIPPGVEKIQITLSAGQDGKGGALKPEIYGVAKTGAKELKRRAVPAEDFMQAFIYKHAVEMQEAAAMVSKPAPFSLSIEGPLDGKPLELPRGKESVLAVKVQREPGLSFPVKLQLLDPPSGIVLMRGFVPPERERAVVTLRVESKTQTQLRSNLILVGTAHIEREEEPAAQEAPKQAQANAKQPSSVEAEKDAKEALKPPERKTKKDKAVATAPALPFAITESEEKGKTK